MSWPSREVRLSSYPAGLPTASDFALVDVTVDAPEEGGFVVRNEFLALDPYLRLSMTAARAQHGVFRLDRVVPALAVGRVVASRNAAFPEGAVVAGHLGWREYAPSTGRGVRVARLGELPTSYALNPLGMPGQTAWVGMKIGAPRAGETVYVSAAAGAVGAIAGQLAVLAGARVVGSAGSAEKVDWLRDIGLAAAFNHREVSVADGLAGAAPDGVDLFFDNVGGRTLEAGIDAMNEHGRIVSCGAIALYNDAREEPGPRNLDQISQKALTVTGFRYTDRDDERDAFEAEIAELLATGRLRVAETFVDGIENTVDAFLSVFTSSPLGKPLVRLAGADA